MAMRWKRISAFGAIPLIASSISPPALTPLGYLELVVLYRTTLRAAKRKRKASRKEVNLVASNDISPSTRRLADVMRNHGTWQNVGSNHATTL